VGRAKAAALRPDRSSQVLCLPLSDTIEYGGGELRPRSGISNALLADLRF